MADKISNGELIEQITQAKELVEIGAKYRHLKSGADYLVENLVFYSENVDQIYVIYKQLYGDGLSFARPIEMWNEIVEVDGKKVPRFVRKKS